jgi:alpha-glucuronidase
MKYGDTYKQHIVNRITGEKYGPYTAAYKRADWNAYHTNNEGEGLWYGDKQIEGTCQFTVSGCETEKAAKAKIRKHVMLSTL